MLRQVGLGLAQPSQIDDPAEPGFPGNLPEEPCRLQVQLVEPRAAPHAVDQVVGAVHPCQGSRQRLAVQRFALDDLDRRRPRPRVHPRRATCQDTHTMAVVKKPGSPPAAEVAGGTGDEDGCGLGHRRRNTGAKS